MKSCERRAPTFVVTNRFAPILRALLITLLLKLRLLNRKMRRIRIRTAIFPQSILTIQTGIIKVDVVEVEAEAVVEAEGEGEDAEDAEEAIIMKGHGRRMGVTFSMVERIQTMSGG